MQIKIFIMEIGIKIRKMEKQNIHGMMGIYILAIIKMIKKMEEASIFSKNKIFRMKSMVSGLMIKMLSGYIIDYL